MDNRTAVRFPRYTLEDPTVGYPVLYSGSWSIEESEGNNIKHLFLND